MSEYLRVKDYGGGLRAELSGARGNALHPQLLQDLESLVQQAAASGSPPIVLSSRGRSFCTGLDLEIAAGFDRAAMTALMGAFHRALLAIFAYPGPIVAALSGHALAGGALLALACDRRILAKGEARFGIHGVHLGVPYPDVAVEICRAQLPRRTVEHALYQGAILGAELARQRGLVDRLVRVTRLEELSWQEIDRLRAAPGRGFGHAKLRLRAPTIDRLRRPDPEGMRRWLDLWFSEDTRRRVHEARRTLRQLVHSDPSRHPDTAAH